MNHTRTWTDLYGSACALFEGRAGGHRWLVAAPPERASELPATLQALDGKGEVRLLVHEGLTPLLAALHEGPVRGVLIVGGRTLTAGPEVTVPEQEVEDRGGVVYREGGTFPAWTAALDLGGAEGECPAASAAASLGVPVVVVSPEGVRTALEAWMDATPHGR
ncbi:hypothetical protein L1280_002523 [Deinococcus sp. HSC-46F16]|uniref:hypothetical protein n=1 Tax=Deinococcus sp. HSC-46F16 TaxID=2910968 RepID=UPI00209EDDAE|nr:hypothetical protein [Deinococcus sp. HSC-46F16]MCP2015361.1 hypothetical protein [Deinococcus sp. HSC-46F16]